MSYSNPTRAAKKLVKEHPDEVLDVLLEHPFWPAQIKPDILYTRRSDDTDGYDNTIAVDIGSGIRAGDAYVEVQSKFDPDSITIGVHCFRSGIGGGGSPRVRNALLFLALAIELDNRDYPQNATPT